MKIEYIRASSYNTFDDCEFKYFLTQVCELEDLSTKKAHLGSICHWVWEVLAKAKKTGHYKLNDKYTDPKYLLNTAWNRYVKKYGHFFEFKQEDYNFCVKVINILLSSKWHPYDFDIFATELQFEVDLNLPGFKASSKNPGKIRGTMDLVTRVDKDTIHVIDYKTGERKKWIGKGMKEWDDFQEDIQLQVYDIALKALFPDIPNRILTIIYVRDGGPFTVTFDEDDRKRAINKLRNRWNKIKGTTNPIRLKDDPNRADEKFKCKNVCYFGKRKNAHGISYCDLYHNIYKKEGLENSVPKIQQLTMEGRPIAASPRNNYDRRGIYKGSVNE